MPTEVDLKLEEQVYGDYFHQNGGNTLGRRNSRRPSIARTLEKVGQPPSPTIPSSARSGRTTVPAYLNARTSWHKQEEAESRTPQNSLFSSWQFFRNRDRQRNLETSSVKFVTEWTHMDAWKNGKFEMLVLQDAHRTAAALLLSKIQREETEEQRRMFSRLVLQDKLRSAVIYLTEQEKGGVMLPADIDTNTGIRVKASRSESPMHLLHGEI